MTDKYADLRAALEAGPTPGPWLGRKDGRFTNMDGWSADHEEHAVLASVPIKAGGEVIAIVVDGRDKFIIEMPELTANADFIAAANPDTVRALLAERDALREALDELANGYAGSGWDIGLRQRLQKARAALAQKQGENHDNQD